LAENQIAIIIIKDKNSTRPATIFVRSFSFTQSIMDEETVTEWSGLQTIVKIESIRIIKDKKTTENRYYISDENEINALYFSHLVRGHWGIENYLHWHLDVTFKEDKCRVRTGNAQGNRIKIYFV